MHRYGIVYRLSSIEKFTPDRTLRGLDRYIMFRNDKPAMEDTTRSIDVDNETDKFIRGFRCHHEYLHVA